MRTHWILFEWRGEAREKSHTGHSEFSFGVLVGFSGAASAMLFCLALFLSMRPEVVKEWQALIAGSLALAGALGTIAIIHRQVVHGKELEDERRRRRHIASAGLLPLALSGLCQYSRECVTSLRGLYDNAADDNAAEDVIQGIPLQRPEPCPRDVTILRECVETAEDEAQPAILALLRHMQVQCARYADIVETANGTPRREDAVVTALNVDTNIIDPLELYARCSAIFDYARGGDPNLDDSVSLGGMQNASRLMDIRAPGHQRIVNAIERLYGENF
jgi:hypothetical protein